jgi:hypothetical protein
MSLFGDGLEAAAQKAVARMLRVSRRTVERYVKEIKKPRPDLVARLEREEKARWQPQIRAKARESAGVAARVAAIGSPSLLRAHPTSLIIRNPDGLTLQ